MVLTFGLIAIPIICNFTKSVKQDKANASSHQRQEEGDLMEVETQNGEIVTITSETDVYVSINFSFYSLF